MTLTSNGQKTMHDNKMTYNCTEEMQKLNMPETILKFPMCSISYSCQGRKSIIMTSIFLWLQLYQILLLTYRYSKLIHATQHYKCITDSLQLFINESQIKWLLQSTRLRFNNAFTHAYSWLKATTTHLKQVRN